MVTWADASQHNRPDRSNTLGVLTGIGPTTPLEGEEVQFALVQWKLGRTPRQHDGRAGWRADRQIEPVLGDAEDWRSPGHGQLWHLRCYDEELNCPRCTVFVTLEELTIAVNCLEGRRPTSMGLLPAGAAGRTASRRVELARRSSTSPASSRSGAWCTTPSLSRGGASTRRPWRKS